MTRIESHLENIDTVIWDWNGTLLNDVHLTTETINSFLKEHGLPIQPISVHRKLVKFPIVNYYKDLGLDMGDQFSQLADQFIARYWEGVHYCNLHKGVLEILEKIQKLQLTQFILTAANESETFKLVQHFKIQDYIEKVYGLSDRLGGSKLKRGNDLLQDQGLTPERTLLIGDTLHDLDVGKSLGFHVVLVSDGHQCVDMLKEAHESVIDRKCS